MESQSSTGPKAPLKRADHDTVFVDTGALSSNPPRERDAGILSAGTLIGGAYKILSHIGKGGMGHVYRARHIILKKDFALKILNNSSGTDVNWVRFQTEAKLIARLDHRNIVKVYNLGLHDDSLPYYAMDLLEGESLEEVIERIGPLGVGDTIDLFIQVCDGLSYAHRHGIIHRDIKPANIMLIVEGDNKPTIKLLDFGIAKLSGLDNAESQNLTAPGEIFGSPLYMSPEQCLGQRVDARSDIYSVGCAIFETLTGKTPHKGESSFQTIIKHQTEEAPSLQEVRPDLDFPPGFEQLIAKALKKRPEDRYQSMQEMLVDLARIKQGKDLTLTYMSMSDYDDLGRNTVSSITHKLDRDSLQQADIEEIEENDNARRADSKRMVLMASCLAGGLVLFAAVAGFFVYAGSKSSAPKIVLDDNAQSVVRAFPKNALPSTSNLPSAKSALAPDKQTPQNAAKKEEPSTNVIGMNLDDAVDMVVNQRWDGKPFIVGQSVDEGMACDNYYFGTLKLGYLSWKRGHTPDGVAFPSASLAAFGKVLVPKGAHLTYMASDTISFDPHVMKGFGANALEALALQAVEKKVNAILANSTHIKTIRYVRLGKSDASDKAIDALNKFPLLEALDIRASRITPAGILKLKRLRDLYELNLREVKGGASVLPAMAGASRIKELKVGDEKISDAQVDAIAGLKSLEILEINNADLTDTQLAKLSSLPNLRELRTLGSKLTPACLADIARFKRLGTWEMNSSNTSWKKPDWQKAEKLVKTFRVRVVVDRGEDIDIPDVITKEELDKIPMH